MIMKTAEVVRCYYTNCVYEAISCMETRKLQNKKIA